MRGIGSFLRIPSNTRTLGLGFCTTPCGVRSVREVLFIFFKKFLLQFFSLANCTDAVVWSTGLWNCNENFYLSRGTDLMPLSVFSVSLHFHCLRSVGRGRYMFTSSVTAFSCLDHPEPLPSALSARTVLGGELAYPILFFLLPPVLPGLLRPTGVRAPPTAAMAAAPTDRPTYLSWTRR